MPDEYANPKILVSTEWVDKSRGKTDKIRIAESDEDVLLYETDHIPEAVKIDWINHLNDPVVRDYIDADRFAELCADRGIGKNTTVVFYGHKNNWWACDHPRNTAARERTCPNTRRKACCAAGTSPARSTCPGRGP